MATNSRTQTFANYFSSFPFASSAVLLPALTFILYSALSLFKMRAYLLDGRFWAEEGSIFFQNIRNLNVFEGLFFVFNRHLELVTNAVAVLASLVSIEYAPLVTTLVSFALQSIPILFVIRFRERFGLKPWALLLFPLLVVGLPEASEVWANSANLHFHFALLAGLIVSMPRLEGDPVRLIRCGLLVSGLSGIPANLLLPVFLLRAVVEGEREDWIRFGILSSTALFQLSILVFSSGVLENRELTFEPVVFLFAILTHHLFGPFFGVDIGQKLADILLLSFEGRKDSLIFIFLVCLLPLVLILRLLADKTGRFLLCAAAVLTIGCLATALGEKQRYVEPVWGGRYFFASNVLLIVGALGLLGRIRSSYAVVFVAALGLASASRVKNYMGGAPWPLALEAARSSSDAPIAIWPEGWVVKPGARPFFE